MVEKAFLEPVKAGTTLEIQFQQCMTLQGGEYLLSLGVTGYEGDDFTVYHRLYDVLNMTVISDKNTVGFFDPESSITVCELKSIRVERNSKEKDNDYKNDNQKDDNRKAGKDDKVIPYRVNA